MVPLPSKPLTWKVLYETRHVELPSWWFLLLVLLKENVTLIIACVFLSLQGRSVSCLLSSRDFSQLLWSQKPAFERHTHPGRNPDTSLTTQVTVKAL